MAKQFCFLFMVITMICTACSAPVKNTSQSGTAGTGQVIIPRGEAKSFQNELAGTWRVISMRRQQKAELEMLNNVTLKFDAKETKFTGKAPCNQIFGTILLNGYSIRFQDIGSTKMACDRLEQEGAYINLLQNRISAFTIEGNKLLLRDGSTNIVFECERDN